MKKILIISYFFPPCNLTAADRIGSWYKYLPEYGFYPIVVTRNWTGKELSEVDRLESSNKQVIIKKTDKGEVHFLPYVKSTRDKFFIKGEKSNNILFKSLSKLITAWTMFWQNFTLKAIPYNNLYYYSREILINNKDIKSVIISAMPFELFYFGFLLKKEFLKIEWIADYRDEWTTSEIERFNFLKTLLWNFQVFSEKKWVKNAKLITTNTKQAVRKLSTLHKKEAKLLINGFDFNIVEKKVKKHTLKVDELVIIHNGTLYPTQKIDILINGIRIFEENYSYKLKFLFPGINIKPDVAKYVKSCFDSLKSECVLMDRVPKESILELQQQADIMLMIKHEGKTGIIGSKIYEYVGLQKPILLCPSDKGELEEIVKNTGLGLIANTPQSLASILLNAINSKREGNLIIKNYNKEAISSYNRKKQVSLLSSFFK